MLRAHSGTSGSLLGEEERVTIQHFSDWQSSKPMSSVKRSMISLIESVRELAAPAAASQSAGATKTRACSNWLRRAMYLFDGHAAQASATIARAV
jgi:hypothetical protein